MPLILMPAYIGVAEVAILFYGVIPLATLVTAIWALLDLGRHRQHESLPLVLWVLIILAFPLLGPLAYYIVGRKSP